MRLRTHVLASPFFLLASSLIAGVRPEPAGFALCALGSVLPDVDKPDGVVGRVFPLSPWIHDRFGHRGLTHSLLELLLCAAANTSFAPH